MKADPSDQPVALFGLEGGGVAVDAAAAEAVCAYGVDAEAVSGAEQGGDALADDFGAGAAHADLENRILHPRGHILQQFRDLAAAAVIGNIIGENGEHLDARHPGWPFSSAVKFRLDRNGICRQSGVQRVPGKGEIVESSLEISEYPDIKGGFGVFGEKFTDSENISGQIGFESGN